MTKPPATQPRSVPDSFRQRNMAQAERVMQLTRKAIAQLEGVHQAVTLNMVVAATRSLDEQSKGLSAKTILRNAEAATLFRTHSPAYQARQHQVKRAKRKRTPVATDIQVTYRGLRASDLIQLVESLKKQNAEIQAERDRFRAERDEAYRLRDEALEHNARQLAALTRQMQPRND
ncbi:MAG: hypothetical protein M1132_10715 [Chloroflexi bacterium]|nr:hypothetical protein [Chloroflexota bacterium]